MYGNDAELETMQCASFPAPLLLRGVAFSQALRAISKMAGQGSALPLSVGRGVLVSVF